MGVEFVGPMSQQASSLKSFFRPYRQTLADIFCFVFFSKLQCLIGALPAGRDKKVQHAIKMTHLFALI